MRCWWLGYSRLLWLRLYSRQTMPVLIEGLESAFGPFGGVPQELLFDQMRAVVVSADRSSNSRASWSGLRPGPDQIHHLFPVLRRVPGGLILAL
jgi:transposase